LLQNTPEGRSGTFNGERQDMAMMSLPRGTLGAIETNGTVMFGIYLPQVSGPDGNAVTVKIIREAIHSRR